MSTGLVEIAAEPCGHMAPVTGLLVDRRRIRRKTSSLFSHDLRMSEAEGSRRYVESACARDYCKSRQKSFTITNTTGAVSGDTQDGYSNPIVLFCTSGFDTPDLIGDTSNAFDLHCRLFPTGMTTEQEASDMEFLTLCSRLRASIREQGPPSPPCTHERPER